jgi:hypothetical protein
MSLEKENSLELMAGLQRHALLAQRLAAVQQEADELMRDSAPAWASVDQPQPAL